MHVDEGESAAPIQLLRCVAGTYATGAACLAPGRRAIEGSLRLGEHLRQAFGESDSKTGASGRLVE